jgi:rubredoxin
MPMKDYKCDKCGYVEEFIFSTSLPKPEIPEVCPKCSEGKLVYEFSIGHHGGFDVIGGYDYMYGKKKNWRGSSDSANPY